MRIEKDNQRQRKQFNPATNPYLNNKNALVAKQRQLSGKSGSSGMMGGGLRNKLAAKVKN